MSILWSLTLGEGLSLEIEDKSIIKVKKEGTPIGELQLSDTDKNKLLPYLNQGLAGIYTCKLSQNCKDAKLNERLRVSILGKKIKANKNVNILTKKSVQEPSVEDFLRAFFV